MNSYIVSARKYRPATFDMVVGQSAITNTLKNAIRNNTLAQAFLFTGPRGVGKTTCARILAKTINCLNPTPEQDPCDQCESCVSFRQSSSFNVHELDAASNNSVDDIRSLIEQVRIPPQVGKYKIYIIDEVHMLTTAAFNAFLKTLEEPPSYAKFILATTEKHKIIPTILSRCQIYDFKRITVEDISRHLAYIADKEGVKLEDDARNIIALKADGALRDALSIFDQMVSFSGRNITYQDVIRNLNVLDYDYYFRMVEYLLSGDVGNILLMLDEVIFHGFDPQHFMSGLAAHMRNLLVAMQSETLSLLEVSDSLRLRYQKQAVECNAAFLLTALEISNECDINYARSSNKRLLVEISLLRIAGAGQKLKPSAVAPLTPQMAAQQQQTKPKSSPSAKAQSVSQQGQISPASQVVELPTEKTPTTAPAYQSQSSNPEVREAPSSTYSNIQASHIAAEPQPVRPTGARTISITQETQKDKDEAKVSPVRNNPFTQEILSKAWDDFYEYYLSISPAFANAVRRLRPELIDQTTVKVKMDNKFVVLDKLNWNALLEYLHKQLNNNQIKLIPEFQKTSVEPPVPYTDREKFEAMMRDYPPLRQFSAELELEPES